MGFICVEDARRVIMNRVICAGSRGITDYAVVEAAILESGFQIDELVSGGARGPDSLSAIWAKKNKISVKFFIPDWNVGRHAGILRNIEMANYATHLIAVTNGSKGTAHMISEARKRNLVVFVKNV